LKKPISIFDFDFANVVQISIFASQFLILILQKKIKLVLTDRYIYGIIKKKQKEKGND